MLAKNAVNIVALHAAPCKEEGIIQFITNNNDATVAALRDAGLHYTTNEVLLVTLADQPGMFARLSRALANQKININAVYITLSGQVVLDVSDINVAQKTIMGLDLSAYSA